MSEVIASKRIVITAEDRVTSVIAKTTQAFNQLEQHLQQLGMKFNNGATEQSSYRSALTQTKSTVGEADEAIKKLNHNIGELKGTHTVDVKVDTKQTNENIKQLKNTADEATKSGHSMTKSFVFGSLVSSGIQSATNSLIGFAKQGFQAAVAGQQVAARWRSLGMTSGQIKEVGSAVTNLKENTNMSGVAVGNLITRFYGMTGSTKQAIALSKGVGSITDSLHLSGEASDAFANGLVRIEASGKVTSQSLGRLERQAPGLSSALQKASGMSKKSFDDLLSSGKMTADQFNDILAKASKDYDKNAKSWDNTTEGALKNIRETWAASWKTMMTPLAQSSGQGLGALSSALTKLQPQFEELGKAVANLATRFANWLTPQHAKDLGTIVGSLGRMAIVLGKGVWKAVTAPLRVIGWAMDKMSGKHGDALDEIATALDHISKNKAAMVVLEGVGIALATDFAYGKLMRSAEGLSLFGKALSALTGKKFSGHLFQDVGKGLRSIFRNKSIDGDAEKAGEEAGSKFSTRLLSRIKSIKIGDLFKGASKDAAKAGDESGSGFVSRMLSKVRGANVEGAGRGIGSKLGGAVAIAFGAIDLFKAVSAKKDRAAKVGKSLGETMGGMAGASVGATLGSAFGPLGTLLGGLLGGAIGSKAGGEVGKAIGKMWPKIKKGASEVGNFLLKVLTAPFHAAAKAGEWLGEKIKGLTHKGGESKSHIKSLGGNHYSKQDIANIRQMNSAVRAYTASLKQLKAVVKKDDPTKQLRNMSKEFKRINPAVEKSAKYWKGLAKPLETSAKAFKVVDKALSSFKGKNNPLDRLDKSVTSLTKTIKKEQFGKLLAKQMQIADKSMSGKHSFVGQFESMTKHVISQLRRFRRTFDSDWRNTWTRLDRYPSQGLSRTASIVSNRLDSVLSREHSFSSRFTSSWKKWVDDVVSAMRSGFDKLPGIAKKAMQGIVSRLNSGISAINNVISDFGGDKRLGTIHYAKGTLFHPGGKAVLNDGSTASKQELVWEPSRGFSLPQGQNTVHDLERGAMVLDAPHTDSILNRMGIPHYAGGTLSDDEQDKIAEEFMDNPIKASRDLVLKVTNWNSNVPVIADLGKATAIGFSRGIANVLKDLLGIIKEPINGDWTPVIKSAFRVLHLHAQGWQIAKFLRQIQTESGGSETIIGGTDGLSDGHATGLLQFKPGTFAHWADPRYSNIMKGFDQIVAAIRCLNAGGEGGWGNFGMGHGWATGGEITSQQFGWVGDNAQHHEFVINPYNSNALPLMKKAWTVMSNNHPEWASQSDGTFASEMIGLMKETIASINSLDLQPVAFVDDAGKAINKYNAKRIGMMRGGR